MELYQSLCAVTKEENVLKDEPMRKHTTFRIGGPADYFVTPESKEEIREIIALCKKENVPYYIVGNGSNLLVGDKGYRGVILQIFKKMNQIQVEDEKITAQAGALLSKVAAAAYEAGQCRCTDNRRRDPYDSGRRTWTGISYQRGRTERLRCSWRTD